MGIFPPVFSDLRFAPIQGTRYTTSGGNFGRGAAICLIQNAPLQRTKADVGVVRFGKLMAVSYEPYAAFINL